MDKQISERNDEDKLPSSVRDKWVVSLDKCSLVEDMKNAFNQSSRQIMSQLAYIEDSRSRKKLDQFILDTYVAETWYEYGAEGLPHLFVDEEGRDSSQQMWAHAADMLKELGCYNLLFSAFDRPRLDIKAFSLYVLEDMVRARLAFDLWRYTGEKSSISAYGLALLGRVKPATVRNACLDELPAERTKNGNIEIDMEEAYQWLRSRRRYVESKEIPKGQARDSFLEFARGHGSSLI